MKNWLNLTVIGVLFVGIVCGSIYFAPHSDARMNACIYAGSTAGSGGCTYMGSGSQPADSDSTAGATTTYLHDIASSASGYVTEIELYSPNSATCSFAVFSKSGSDFTDDHYVTGLSVASGLNTYSCPSDFSCTALPIVSGEYIGISSSDTWEKATSGGSGYWYQSGVDTIGDATSSTFTQSGNTTHELQLRVCIE